MREPAERRGFIAFITIRTAGVGLCAVRMIRTAW
jgi:hypothetical protein